MRENAEYGGGYLYSSTGETETEEWLGLLASKSSPIGEPQAVRDPAHRRWQHSCNGTWGCTLASTHIPTHVCMHVCTTHAHPTCMSLVEVYLSRIMNVLPTVHMNRRLSSQSSQSSLTSYTLLFLYELEIQTVSKDVFYFAMALGGRNHWLVE